MFGTDSFLMLQQASTAWVGSWFLGGPNSGYPFDILLTNVRHSLLTYGKIYAFRVNNIVPVKDSPRS